MCYLSLLMRSAKRTYRTAIVDDIALGVNTLAFSWGKVGEGIKICRRFVAIAPDIEYHYVRLNISTDIHPAGVIIPHQNSWGQ